MDKYIYFFFYSAKRTFLKPGVFCGIGFLLIICLIVFLQFWKVIDIGNTHGLNFRTNIIWYLAFNEWLILSIPSIHAEIETDITKKYFYHRFLTPISYLGLKFSEGMGQFVVNLFFLGIISILFSYLSLHTFAFNCFWMWAFFICLTILSGAIGLIFQIIIGLLGFWIDEVIPFYWIWEKMLFVFGGLLFPLFIYPNWLQIVSYCTPFSSILAMRSSLVFNPSFNCFLFSFFSSIAWIIFGVLLMNFIFCKAQKHVLKRGI